MFKSLNRFLEQNPIEDLVNYDIKNESPWDEVNAEKAPIQKIQKYKDCNRNTSLSFDCDNSNGTCDFVDSIYKELWGWSFRNRMNLPSELYTKFNNDWDRLGSDTMNSFSTIYRQAIKINSDNKSSVKQNKHLQKFATLTHTIGNLTLVPFKIDFENDKKSFNQYRGFRGNETNKYFVYDFFDLSLKMIKENVDPQTFKEYIEIFYLQDFVNMDDNYSIKPLLKKHKPLLAQNKMSLDKPESFLPDHNDELNEYLINVNKLIMQRSNRLVNALKNKLDLHDTEATRESNQSKRKIRKFPIKVIGWSLIVMVSFVISILLLFEFAELEGIIIKNAIEQYGILAVGTEIIQNYTTSILIFFLFAFVILFVLIKISTVLFDMILDKLGRCTSCHKLFAMKKVKNHLINVADISIKKELKQKNLNGEVIGTTEQYIPGKRKTYEMIHQCKYCKEKQVSSYSQNYENV
ncbi:hypothetical protein [Alkalihalobacillus trypoxylicola]|uniref:Uncharacterized protein n=2 Tax=Alkalihalobacillus trypoxylicola TaxID=519424 RepID=A0A161PKE2_9BACI|nr:hypothetical protein [Alkalihalobacillus trypoxylicola]KYG33899.1 hypothetical protein AZF04_15420 [Alkalihalobacillus trypoxylicola]